MKVGTTVAAASMLFLPVASAMKRIRSEAGRVLDDGENRELFAFTVIFDECMGKQLDECQGLIQAAVDANPEIFENRSSLNYEVTKVREGSDDQYYLVGLRTNQAETGVVGILGDGMVFYPWDWCLTDTECYTVGPWDCDIGTPLTVEQCCNMIKASMPNPDKNGNLLDCYADPPVGSVSNPTDYGRVMIHVNAANKVVHPPRNE